MKQPLHFGRFLANNLFRTSEGEFFLSSSPEGTSVQEAKKNPFPEARERDGLFAAIRGLPTEDVILGCSLVEAVPPLASSVFARLVDANKGIRGRVLELAREVRDEIVGEPEPVPAKEQPLEIKASGPQPLCVIDIGHHPDAPGATGRLNGKKVSEFTFNKELAAMIQAKVKNARIITINREPGNDEGRRALPAKTNALNPNFVISLHANAADTKAGGSEVLYFHTSTEGKKFAGILQKHFLARLGLRDRKIKPKTSSDRGGDQLAMTKVVIVLGEPFFIDNEAEFAAVAAKKDELAAAYADAIDEYATTISNPAPSAVTEKIVASTIAPKEDDFVFVTKDLTKEQFLKQNDKELTRLIAAVNVRLSQKYGAATCPLTREDAWVITYCEAGLRNGKVDPDHQHSEGERGLLPLASNIRDWNGPDAPVWNKPMPIARNLEHFFLYLGHLKNKDLTGGTRRLYMGLFRIDKIKDNTVRQAKVLAGVVHGYFYSGNYRATPPAKPTIPYDDLVSGYQRDVGLAKLMKDTTYVHAGKPLMEGRQQNIETALGLL
jgi:N-acetylmuramoyl-L-alanine amidase